MCFFPPLCVASADDGCLWQMTEKLQDTENEAMSKIVELEMQLMHRNKELDSIRVRETTQHSTALSLSQKALRKGARVGGHISAKNYRGRYRGRCLFVCLRSIVVHMKAFKWY